MDKFEDPKEENSEFEGQVEVKEVKVKKEVLKEDDF